MSVTFVKVNEAIRVAGGSERLTQLGLGCFRFVDGTTHSWPVTTVHTPNINDFSVEQWLAHWGRLRGRAQLSA